MRAAILSIALLTAGFAAGWWFARGAGGSGNPDPALASKVDRLAERVETLSARLEPLLPAGPDPGKVHDVSIGDSPIRGPKDAPVTIVELSDFECAYCGAMAPVLSRLTAEFPRDLRWVFKHRPMPFHKRAVLAHRAAVAAGEQGKFWEMHDRLFAAQDKLDMESLRAHAAALSLDLALFEEQMASPESAAPLLADEEEARKLGVEGVPAYFLNGRYFAGSVPYEQLRERIESELKSRKPQ